MRSILEFQHKTVCFHTLIALSMVRLMTCQQVQDSPRDDNILSSRELFGRPDTFHFCAIVAQWNLSLSSSLLMSRLLPSNGRTATGSARVSLIVSRLLSRKRTGQASSKIDF